eukprot:TRINITY_DN9340_c0_g2_i2.p1 TRINITY_DN9340_c0_g2~~TRINITY_DN9340_c0_g2_i2.p1  ORF type:complete len:1396 (+),score=191.21 TRINITY_DN9340_c0_g2_i2:567-4190(+)
MDKIMDVFIRRMIKGILLVPGENIRIRPSSGEFHLEKAQLCSSNLDGLHLPLSLKAGIFDMIHFQLKFGKIARGNHRLMLVIENVILVVGPGHHQERPAPAWEYDTVMAAKTKLINLACRWIEIFAKPRKQAVAANAGKPGSVRKEKRGVANWIKNRGTKLLKNILSNGMHLSINNLEIRYEDDTSDICGPYRVLGGVVMETLQLRAVSARQRPIDESMDFRTSGHWRPGPGKRAEVEYARKDISMKDLNMKGLWNLGMQRMHDVFDFHHGIQGGLHGHGFTVFFDLIPRRQDSQKESWSASQKDETSITSRYGARLRDNSGAKVTDFLKQRRRLRKWEKVRLGLCSHIMSKLLERRKKQEAVHLSEHRLREKARRLRDLVAKHFYLVEPVDFTVHFLVWPAVGSGDSPQLDVDVRVHDVSLLMDVRQLKSAAALLGYLRRWVREDRTFYWSVPPRHLWHAADVSAISGLTMVRLRWFHALRLVLQGIHNRYPWRALGWMQMRRLGCMRRALSDELLGKRPNEKRIEVLQMALPLADVLAVRKQAYVEIKTRRKMERRQRRIARASFLSRFCRCGGPSGASNHDDHDDQDDPDELEQEIQEEVYEDEVQDGQDDVEIDGQEPQPTSMGDAQDIKLQMNSSDTLNTKSTTAKKKNGDELNLKAALEFVQCNLLVSRFCADLLLEPTTDRKSRRVLMRCAAVGIEALAVHGAPYQIWCGLASPTIVAATKAGSSLHKLPAIRLQVFEANAVFAGAPNDASNLRSLFSIDRKRAPPQANGEFRPMFQLRASVLENQPMTETEARQSPWGRRGVKSIPSPWHIAACCEAFEANVCKAFLMKLRKLVLSFLAVPHLSPADIARRAMKGTHDLEDPCLMWVLIEEFREKRTRRLKNMKFAKRVEQALGQRGPIGDGQRFRGHLLFPSGLRASVVDAYHANKWLLIRAVLPPGSADMQRDSWPPRFGTGYRPSCAEAFRSPDGWWFESEEQASNLAAIIARGGVTESQNLGYGDECFADTGAQSLENAVAPSSDDPYGWGDLLPEGLLGCPPNFSSTGLPPQPQEPLSEPVQKSSLRQQPFLGFACAAPCTASPAAIVAVSMAKEAMSSVADAASAKLKLGTHSERTTTAGSERSSNGDELRLQAFQPAQIPMPKPYGREWLAMPASELELWSQSMGVEMEVLPKGALGLPAPASLNTWWKELGLVNPTAQHVR